MIQFLRGFNTKLMSYRIIAFFVSIALTALNATAQFWEVTSGPPASTACLASNSKGHVFAGTTVSAVYKTTDYGSSWERKDKGIDTGGTEVFTVNQIKFGYNDVMYAAVNGYGIVKSLDDGETWKKLNINIDISRSSRLSVSTKILSDNRTALLVGYDGGAGAQNLLLRYSEDDGETFVNIPKTGLPGQVSSIYDVFLSPNSDKMFVAVSYNMGLFRTTNRGLSWRRINVADTPAGESGDNFLTFAADRNGRIFVGRNALPESLKSLNAVIMRSSDDGESWSYLTNGWDNRDITNNRITAIAFGPYDEVWTITEKTSGTFFSSDGGDSWISRNDGLEGDGSGRGITTTPGNNVFVAPNGPLVYRHLNVNSVEQNNMQDFGVIGAAPNPASDVFVLTFDTKAQQRLSLQLVGIDGRLISEYSKIYEPGSQRAMLDVSGLPSGIYGWRLFSDKGYAAGVVTVISH